MTDYLADVVMPEERTEEIIDEQTGYARRSRY